jgi:type IV secretion system protein TrbL
MGNLATTLISFLQFGNRVVRNAWTKEKLGKRIFFKVLLWAMVVWMCVGGTLLLVAQPNTVPGAWEFQVLDSGAAANQANIIAVGARSAVDLMKIASDEMKLALSRMKSSTLLNDLGKKIAVTLWVLLTVWTIIKGWLMNSKWPQFVGDMFMPTFITGMAIFAMEGNIGSVIAGSVDSISSAVASSAVPGGTGSPQPVAIATSALDTAGKVWDSPTGSWIKDFGATLIVVALLKLLAIGFIVLGGAMAYGIMMLAEFQLAVAFLLAPVLIPWIVFKPTAFLADGWLRFLLVACFAKLMVTIVDRFASTYYNRAANLAQMASDSMTGNFVVYAVLAFMSVFIAFLFLKSTGLAESLVGSSSLGLSGWASVASGGMAGAALGKAASATGGAARDLARGIKSGASGEGATSVGKNGQSKSHQDRPRGVVGRALFDTANSVARMGSSKGGTGAAPSSGSRREPDKSNWVD